MTYTMLGSGLDVLMDAEGKCPAMVGHSADAHRVGMFAVGTAGPAPRRPSRQSA